MSEVVDPTRIGARYTCPYCDKQLASQSSVNRHIRDGSCKVNNPDSKKDLIKYKRNQEARTLNNDALIKTVNETVQETVKNTMKEGDTHAEGQFRCLGNVTEFNHKINPLSVTGELVIILEEKDFTNYVLPHRVEYDN